MVSLSQVEKMILSKIPDAKVMVQDLGGGDHLDAIVISTAFKGQSLVKQHQMVYAALKEDMASEAIHALALKTFTPEDWLESGQAS